MSTPLVSIVTVQYGHQEVTLEFLKSLTNISYKHIEIIVVDNAGPNTDTSLINKEYPDVIVINSNENLGFAGGNNLGFKKAKGEYIFLLNNDTEVDKGFIEPLLQTFEQYDSVGVVSPKIRFFHTPDTIQYAGYEAINVLTQRGGPRGFGQVDKGQFDVVEETNFGHGAAMMVSRVAIEKAGMMPELYFLYYEELDWIEHIKNAGFKVYYNHKSLVLHKESISTGGRISPLKAYYMSRNRVLFLRRNVKGFIFFFALLYQLFVALPKNALMFLLKREFLHFRKYVSGFFWHLQNLSTTKVNTINKL